MVEPITVNEELELELGELEGRLKEEVVLDVICINRHEIPAQCRGTPHQDSDLSAKRS